MKQIGFFAAAVLLLCSLSCNQDIDLTAEWKDIPIVYGLVNAADTAHYIRVEKAFQDQDGNAFFAALEPDSIYYSDVTVKLLNLTTGKEAVLQRVDGVAEGYPRDEGDFAQMPNYLYKVRSPLFPMEGGDEVRFILDRGEGKDLVTAECVILDELIPQGGLTPGSKIDFPLNRDVSFRWRAGEEARIFDISLIIHYQEKFNNDPTVYDRSLEWTMVKGIKRTDGSATVTGKVSGQEFYSFLADKIEVRNDVTRLLTSMDFVVKGGGEAVEQYIAIALANTGITSSQDIPVYTNLSEGRGIFTSVVASTVTDLLLGLESEENLKSSTFTQDLNFQ